ncbi:MAG TPA: DUF192 domain-containing protein [Candidatus Gastranaerophilales bacterium]|nr:DUF192 domain-containing protein [Candidatus Gastranaerophilales bacterium]
MKVINKTANNVLVEKLEIANNSFLRMKGLLGRKSMEEGEGLHIIPCNNIHSWFMKFEFDAIFIDKKNKIKFLIEKMPPNGGVKFCFSAYSVIELPAGAIAKTNVKIGDEVEFI